MVRNLVTSSLTEITKALSKVGGTDAAATELSTESSEGYIPSSQTTRPNTPFTQAMYAAKIIQPTPHQEASTHRHTSSSLPSDSHQSSIGSWSTLNLLSPPRNNVSSEKDATQQPPLKGSKILTNGIKLAANKALSLSSPKPGQDAKSPPLPSKFDQSLSTDGTTRKAPPRPYRADLTPQASTLRPHCLARDRLRLWRPSKSRLDDAEGGIELSETDLNRILHVINVSWAQGTRDVYRAGLLVFHVFCDLRQVPEDERCPASPLLIITFILSCAGSYAGTTLGNYVFAIKAWHVLHGANWIMNDAEIKATLTGATVLAPPTSK